MGNKSEPAKQEFTLYELSVLANALERQRKRCTDEYTDRMAELDRISKKLRYMIYAANEDISELLREKDTL